MEKFNKELAFNYFPSGTTYDLGLSVMERLIKLNGLILEVFADRKMPSKIFAFIESKYSSRIEGIYTTLFENVNTGFGTDKQDLIKPIVNELFKEKGVPTLIDVKNIASVLNAGIDTEQRYSKNFGVYKVKGDAKEMIYQPPLEVKEIDKLLKEIMDKAKNDRNLIQMIHSHIIFEMIHPFVDGNGRIGRLVLQKGITRLMNFCEVLPLSHALNSSLHLYYDAFVIKQSKDVDKGVQNILNIMLKMCDTTEAFLKDLKPYLEKYLPVVKNASIRVSHAMALEILLSLQTSSSELREKHNIHVRTVDAIFDYLNGNDLPFNRKIVNRQVVF